MSLKQFIITATMFFTATAFAQQTQPAAEVDSKGFSEQAQQIKMAGELVKYGYQTKTALPLIQAVQIYKKLNVVDATGLTPKESAGSGDESKSLTKTDVISYNEDKILEDATKFAEGNKSLLALISDTKKATRGVVGGPRRIVDRVLGNHTDTWTFTFRGGESAYVAVNGDGDTDLDLYIYDENNNLITYDDDSTDLCICRFTPKWTGKFYIKIVNRGSVYNQYVLVTN